MNIETIMSALTLLGVGGIIGKYFQVLFERKKEADDRIASFLDKRYMTIMVDMRLILKPESIVHFSLEKKPPDYVNSNKEISTYYHKQLIEQYYNGFLYASDDVLKNISWFINNPSNDSFKNSAMSMRQDLWKRKKLQTDIELEFY